MKRNIVPLMSQLIAACIITVPLIVLIGWQYDIEVWKRIHPSFVAMNPLTAVAFILTGIALFTLNWQKKSMITVVCGLLVCAIGAVKLIDIAFGMTVPLDQLLFSQKLEGQLDTIPNRMAPNTAACFFLLGLALMSTRLQKRIAISQFFLLPVLFISLFAIGGYFYNMITLYGIGSYIPMAAHTAACFFIAAVCLLFLDSHNIVIAALAYLHNWFQNLSMKYKCMVGFGTSICIIVIAALYGIGLMQTLQVSSEEQERVARATENALLIERELLSIIIALDQYSETKEEKFVDQIVASRQISQMHRNELSSLTRLPQVREALEGYESILPHRQALADRIIQLEQQKASPSALVTYYAERDQFDEIARGYLTTIIAQEKQELVRALQNTAEVRDLIVRNVIMLISLVLFVIVLTSYLITTSITTPVEQLSVLAEEIAHGNLQARTHIETTDEIGMLAQRFNTMAIKLKQNQEQLQNEKAKDEALLRSIGDGVFAVDDAGRIHMMNPVAEDLSGYRLSEAQGKYYGDIFQFHFEKNRAKPYPDFVGEVIKTGKKRGMANHTILKRKDGSTIPIADSASPIHDAQGHVTGAIVVFRDTKKERELEESKDNFLSVAAHDLRTPLGTMRWSLEIILHGDMGKLPAKVQDMLKQVYESNLRLISLVGDLLDVSRIDQGRVENNSEEVQVEKIIQSVIAELESMAHKKEITVRVHAKNTIPTLRLDPKRFTQVMENLISNAIKYNKQKGSVDITLESHPQQVNLEVADTGIGIPQKDQAQIFSKFFRAENARLSETNGTGLGLFSVKSFIENWGGTITYTSKEQKGTTMHITLPVDESGKITDNGST